MTPDHDPQTYTLELVYLDELALPSGAEVVPINIYIADQLTALEAQQENDHDQR